MLFLTILSVRLDRYAFARLAIINAYCDRQIELGTTVASVFFEYLLPSFLPFPMRPVGGHSTERVAHCPPIVEEWNRFLSARLDSQRQRRSLVGA